MVAEIEERIRALSPDERTELVRSLIAELDGDVARAWLEDAQRRYQQAADGEVTPVPGEQVFTKLRARLQA